MKAVGYFASLPITDTASLQDLIIPDPTPRARDLLVRVAAIAVNPVDTKIRARRAAVGDLPEIIGWDAVGIVESVGHDVTLFKAGDRVYYAGELTRPGANSELHAVDERLASLAPTTLDDADAAALPLTAITAWEMLFDRLGVAKGGGEGQALLIVGGAGGVGSILIQLARQLTKLRVIATASRPETVQWCLDLGAHAVIDHRQPFVAQLGEHGLDGVEYVAALTHTGEHFAQIVESLHPQGHICVIDDPATLDVVPLKTKSIALHWELMYTRSLFQTADMGEQGRLLGEVAAMIDAGQLRTTAGEHLGSINAANLRRAHALLESGKAVGKLTLAGFD
jgi:zinc-binding alcohol dehydrogenase family protein